jgi:putative addiction module component (TIGR02574 family)
MAIAPELRQLSVAERLALLEKVCESLADDARQMPLSEAQKRLIGERLELYRTRGLRGTPVEEAVSRIRARRA